MNEVYERTPLTFFVSPFTARTNKTLLVSLEAKYWKRTNIFWVTSHSDLPIVYFAIFECQRGYKTLTFMIEFFVQDENINEKY